MSHWWNFARPYGPMAAANGAILTVLGVWTARLLRRLDASPPTEAEKPLLLRQVRKASIGASACILATMFWVEPHAGGWKETLFQLGWLLFMVAAGSQIMFTATRRLRGLQATRLEVARQGLRTAATIFLAGAFFGLCILAAFIVASLLQRRAGLPDGFWFDFGQTAAGWAGFCAAYAAWACAAPLVMRLSAPCERPPAGGDLESRVAACFARAGHPAPDLWLIAMDRLGYHNALLGGMLTPWRWPRQTLFISKRLIDSLTPEELDSVVLHEASHGVRGHAWKRVLRVWALVAFLIVMLWAGGAVLRGVIPAHQALASWLPGLLLIPALRVQRWGSRRQELEADEDAVLRFGASPAVAASMLRKLAEFNAVETRRNPPLVGSHPTVDERIAEFERRFAAHAAGAAPDRGAWRDFVAGRHHLWAGAVILASLFIVWRTAFVVVPAHALRLDAEKGDAAGIADAVARGADPSRPDTYGGLVPPLFAAIRARRAESVRALLTAGVDPNRPDPDGVPPLSAAVASDCPACVFALLAKGAALDGHPEHRQATALQDAVWDGRAEIVKLLLAAGADPDQRDRMGQPLLINAIDEFPDVATVSALLDAGAAVDLPDHSGRTPLIAAVHSEESSRELVAALLAHGARPDVRAPKATPLEDAKRLGDKEVVRLLADAAAHPRRTTPKVRRP